MKKLLSILLFIPFLAWSQVKITQPNPVINYNTKYFTNTQLQPVNIDTFIENFQQCDLIDQQKIPYYQIGNLGLAYAPLVFNYNKKIGFDAGFNTLDLYNLTNKNVQHYISKTPYTQLNFLFGGKAEINGEAKFAMNTKKKMGFGFNYKRINFNGQTPNQKSAQNHLSVNNFYTNKKENYTLINSYIFNSIKNNESGGWVEDSVFEKYTNKRSKAILETTLQNASNQIKNNQISVFQIFKIKNKKDSNAIANSTYKIIHHFEFDNWKTNYKDFEDSTSVLYNKFYFNNDTTNDKAKFWSIKNTIYFKNNETEKYIYNIGLLYSINKYKQQSNQKIKNDVQLLANFFTNDSSKLQYKINAMVDIAPQYIGDFNIDANIYYNLQNKINFGANTKINISKIAERDNEYYSNHYTWNNNFKRTKYFSFEPYFEWKKQQLYVSLNNQIIQNYMYNDTNSLPQQYNKSIYILTTQIQKDFNWKNIYWSNKLFINFTNNTDIIRLPLLYLKESIYYKGGFFTGKLNAQLGMDITYNTNFKSNNYNPATLQFYQQNNTTFKFYPIMDVFFNLQVKTVQISLKMQHINQGMFKQKGIYVAPNYGFYNRSFRASVVWQFFD